MQDFKKLMVWKKAHELTLSLYKLTGSFPREEVFGLTGQIRRAASSIAANIAEGCGRDSKPDLIRFLTLAMGSASELEYHLLLAHDLKLLRSEDFNAASGRVLELKRMLYSLVRTLRAPSEPRGKRSERPNWPAVPLKTDN